VLFDSVAKNAAIANYEGWQEQHSKGEELRRNYRLLETVVPRAASALTHRSATRQLEG